MTTTPHDALFKATFEQPAKAAELLRSFLDPALSARIDWSTLVLESGSLVDAELHSQHTDLLFTARLDGREIHIYLRLEHQSRPDRWIGLWLLRYIVGLWVRHVDRHRDARLLPPVLPVVVHHDDKAWAIAPQLSAVVDCPADLPGLAAFVPDFRFVLVDLATIDSDTLRTSGGSAATRMALLALKEARTAADLKQLLLGWLTILNELEREYDGNRAIALVSRYLVATRGAEEFRRIDLEALGIGKAASEAIMTYETYLLNQGIQRGIEQGREQGREQGQQALFLRMLHRKFADVPADIVRKVEAADVDHLGRWVERILFASTLDEIFAD